MDSAVERRIKNIGNTSICAVFTCCLFVMALLFFFVEKREFSDIENRELAGIPVLWNGETVNNSFYTDFDRFYSDAFPFRDQFLLVNRAIQTVYTALAVPGDDDDIVFISTSVADMGNSPNIGGIDMEPGARPATQGGGAPGGFNGTGGTGGPNGPNGPNDTNGTVGNGGDISGVAVRPGETGDTGAGINNGGATGTGADSQPGGGASPGGVNGGQGGQGGQGGNGADNGGWGGNPGGANRGDAINAGSLKYDSPDTARDWETGVNGDRAGDGANGGAGEAGPEDGYAEGHGDENAGEGADGAGVDNEDGADANSGGNAAGGSAVGGENAGGDNAAGGENTAGGNNIAAGEGVDGTASADAPGAGAAAQAQTRRNDEYEANESTGVSIVAGQAFEIFVFSESRTIAYAETIDAIAAKCGVPAYLLTPPSGSELFLPEKYRGFQNEQKPAFNLLSASLKNVTYVDMYDTFMNAKDDYLYFKTDHHWTADGAYLAYERFIRATGGAPVGRNRMKEGRIDDFLGSLYRQIYKDRHSALLEHEPDYVRYYEPLYETTVTNYVDAEMTEGWQGAVLVPDGDLGTNLYNVFFGGDMRLLYMRSAISNGRSILVVRDSFGHAFLPFLANNYEHVYAVEPRYFDEFPLAQFIADNGISELLFLNHSILATGRYWYNWIPELEKLK